MIIILFLVILFSVLFVVGVVLFVCVSFVESVRVRIVMVGLCNCIFNFFIFCVKNVWIFVVSVCVVIVCNFIV